MIDHPTIPMPPIVPSPIQSLYILISLLSSHILYLIIHNLIKSNLHPIIK